MQFYKVLIGLIMALCFLVLLSFRSFELNDQLYLTADTLRKLYAQPSSKWPKPTIDKGVNFDELGSIPASAFKTDPKRVELGKILFFDKRLSSSDKISCSSCHQPHLNWTDGLPVSIGHNNALNTRNSPTIENVWFYKQLFWDGRAKNLEEQAQIPLTSKIEMHQNMSLLPKKLEKISGYLPLFRAAFGDSRITSERIVKSLADFQRTIVSSPSAFDRFLAGDKNSLTDEQLLGLHLFRTKARCMNCHYGALFTDNDFHNLGLSNYGQTNQDLGLYQTTKNPNDVGKFKTPSLRNVMFTGPWFHDGSVKSIDSLMLLYNMGMPFPAVTLAQLDDPLLPKNDRLLRGIRLNKSELHALVAFLNAISTKSANFEIPKQPK
ncbi:cytochrome c peroxidase [Pedobacter sp. Du54]|uniref:cytochrome-c peroxidase n=1 Tax=Pedobacter anseongensis TaxID=3133439 RepID=UPI0030A73D71